MELPRGGMELPRAGTTASPANAQQDNMLMTTAPTQPSRIGLRLGVAG